MGMSAFYASFCFFCFFFCNTSNNCIFYLKSNRLICNMNTTLFDDYNDIMCTVDLLLHFSLFKKPFTT